MANPVLVEVVRGALVESGHSGAIAVSDGDGDLVLSLGDVDRPVFPRSAVKAFQALPLLESGIADRLQLTDAEIALVVSSHNGEPRHTVAAEGMLKRVGLDRQALECGVHWPFHQRTANDMLQRDERPSALHNNCSGKHSGFICLACGDGRDPAGYVKPGHPTMAAVMGAVCDMAGATLDADRMAIDGCSIPTLAAPLRLMARGFARLATGEHLGPERARAGRRILAAVAREPFMVAGTDDFDTDVMTLLGERVFVKTGAEGVYCAAFPALGLGVALKCDDGAGRAAEVMMAAAIARFVPMSGSEKEAFRRFLLPTLRNWNGILTGGLRPAGALGEQLPPEFVDAPL